MELFFKRYRHHAYLVFRVFVGLLFFQHGAMKILGWFGAQGTAAFPALMFWVGLIELIGGLAIAVGFWTRIWAFLSGVVMIAAYFKAHFPNGWVPVMNKGELALLYLAAFIVILALGSGQFSLDTLLRKKS